MGIQLNTHLPCLSCGSSDALSVYQDEDNGRQYWKCFSCGGKGKMTETDDVPQVSQNLEVTDPPRYKYKSIPERDISVETCKHFKVTRDNDIIAMPYPKGVKCRALSDKKFWEQGKVSGLFGMDKFNSGGKYVTITEGELDAMSNFQMFGGKYPSVSVRNAGTALQDCKDAYEWLNTFDHIVIAFDNDKPGQQAANAVAELFAGKSKIVKFLKHKDANEYLMNQDTKEYIDAWWGAELFQIDGIIDGMDLLDELLEPKPKALVSYPYGGLNKLTYGIRKGELVMVTAGSGLGKSQFIREIVWQCLQKTEVNCGLIFLEEDRKKTAESLVSMAANKPLHLPTTSYTREEYVEWHKEVFGSRRVKIFSHFAHNDIDNLLNRAKYMIKAQNCELVVFDHISMVVSSQQYGDERKALDEIMTRLRLLVQETNVAMIAVSHLKRPEGKGHEEGASTSLAQLRGSGSIAQLSDIVIGLERDGQADDERERNTSYFRVLKNRFCGATGPAGSALYSQETGRMIDNATVIEKEEKAL